MRLAHAMVLKPSHPGWRCTWSDSSGPLVSVWAPTCLEASTEAESALRRMDERTDRSGRNAGDDPRWGECE